MTKYLIAAVAIAAALFAVNPSAAQAGTKVHVYLGAGGPYIGADAVHYRKYRRHRRHHRHYRHYRPHRPYYRPARYTLPRWRVVRRMNRRGYYDCHRVRRRGDTFKMRCFRNGRLFKVRVSAWNGRIIRRHRIH